MSEWQKVKLSDISDIIAGYAFKGNDFSDDGDELVIKIKDIQEPFVDTNGATKVFFKNYSEKKLEKFLVKKGDFVIAMTGATIGKIGRYVDSGYAYINQRVAKFEAKKGTDKDFLYFVTQHPNFKTHILNNIDSQSAQGNISATSIGRYFFYFPSLPEQNEIAQILKSIDQKIELNQRMNETLEGMARAIFKSWFVDFDPVHAKAAGKEPDGMDAATAALFPSTFTDDGLPEGWEEKPISKIGDVITGKTPSTKDEENYGDQMPFITIPDMHGKIYVLHCGKYLSSKGVSTQKNKTLPAGSICVSCIATPGLTILTHEECQTNQQINAVVPFKDGLKNFRFWQIKEVSEEVISKGSGGSVFHNLNKSQFSDLKIIETSFELANVYEEIVSPLMEKILENEKQNQTLAALRDTLLPKLISGELRVNPATEPLKEAVG